MQPLCHSFKSAIATGSPTLCTFVDPISDERNRTVRAGWIAGGIVAGHRAKESHLVTSLVSIFSPPPTVSVAMPLIPRTLFYIVIDVGPFWHLREIQCHPVKDHPRLCIAIDVFVAGPSDRRRARHQLRDHENNYHDDKYRHE